MGASAAGVAPAVWPMWGAVAAAAPVAGTGAPGVWGAFVVGRPGSAAAEVFLLRPNQPRRAGAVAAGAAAAGFVGSV